MKTASKEELDRLCREFCALPDDSSNSAARKALEERIFICAMELFPNRVDGLSSFWLSDWKNYDPEKIGGNAYAFFASRLKFRERSQAEEDIDGPRKDSIDEVTGEKKKVKQLHIRLDAPMGEDGEDRPTPADIRADPAAQRPYIDIEFDEGAYELVKLIMDMLRSPASRKNNEVRRNYTRLFFTDTLAALIHQEEAPRSYLAHQDDVFSVIKIGFLDYFMRDVCRTVAAIAKSPLRLYGEMVEGRPMEEPKQPLPNDVYITYLDRIEHYQATAPAVSMQRKEYQTLMRNCLC